MVAQWVKNPPANVGDQGNLGSIPELGRPLKKEMATHSTLDRGASWATVTGIAKSRTRLNSNNLNNEVIFLKKEKKIYIYVISI